MSKVRAWALVQPKAGKYAGAMGVVREVRDNGMVRVHFEGIHNGEAINTDAWLKADGLEVVKHG